MINRIGTVGSLSASGFLRCDEMISLRHLGAWADTAPPERTAARRRSNCALRRAMVPMLAAADHSKTFSIVDGSVSFCRNPPFRSRKLAGRLCALMSVVRRHHHRSRNLPAIHTADSDIRAAEFVTFWTVRFGTMIEGKRTFNRGERNGRFRPEPTVPWPAPE